MKLVLFLALAGCAEIPPCPYVAAHVVQVEDGSFLYGFDRDNLKAWVETIKQHALGKCAYAKEGGI